MPCYKAISTIYNGPAGDKLATLFKTKYKFYLDDSYMYNIKDGKLSKQPFCKSMNLFNKTLPGHYGIRTLSSLYTKHKLSRFNS